MRVAPRHPEAGHPGAPGRRPARSAFVVALLVALISAAVGGIASHGDPARSAAGGLDGSANRSALAAGGALRSGAFSADGTAAAASPVAAAVATPARPAARGMSMDARIQGGLSAHQEQAIAARLLSAHQDAGTAAQSAYWTPAMGRTAVARAESWLGMPYSWAGGNATGPTTGRCEAGDGADLDCHVVGFDCSGLMMYAWGPYTSMPHLASSQVDAGDYHPAVDDLLPGDLVFFSGYLPGGTGHVAIYAGDGTIIEAPQSGEVVTTSTLARAMAEDGAYRGAVRPLTAKTPTISAAGLSVTTSGGAVTLHGAHLAGVTSVHLDGVTIRSFTRQTDSAIRFAAPAHRAGTVAVSVSTSWKAQSGHVALHYVAPRRTTPKPTPPTSTPPTSTPPTSTPPKTSPTPVPTSSAKPTPKPSPTSSSSGARSAAPASPAASPAPTS